MTLEESAVAHLRGAVHRVLPSVRTDLDALIRIPSVSADPALKDQVRRSAEAILSSGGAPGKRSTPSASTWRPIPPGAQGHGDARA